MEKMTNFPSAFVPESIETKLNAFLGRIAWHWQFPASNASQNEQIRARIFLGDKNDIMRLHKEVFDETIEWLGCPEKSFPFPENSLEQQS